MTAYVISDIGAPAPEDRAAWEAYLAMAPETIHRYGGRYVVRGGGVDVLEGDWSPHAVVVVEFPDQETAARWYASPEYARCMAVRAGSGLRRNMILVEGADDDSPAKLL